MHKDDKHAHGTTPSSRREVLQWTGAAGLAALVPQLAAAQGSDTLKVGFISPRTGPLGSFGEGDGYVLELARKALAGGLVVGAQNALARSARTMRSLAKGVNLANIWCRSTASASAASSIASICVPSSTVPAGSSASSSAMIF